MKEEDRRRGVEIELLELDKGEDEDDDIAIELGVSKEKKMSWGTYLSTHPNVSAKSIVLTEIGSQNK